MSKKLSLLAVLAAALAVSLAAAGAFGHSAGTPGVTPNSILLGGTAPLSGEAAAAAAVARGAEAYFKYVNDRGGVFGRKITYKYLDDAYDPSRSVQAVRQLVQQDQVFAMFNTLGTNVNLAIRDFLNQEGVPQLFVATGAHTFGADSKRYPWTIGYIPSYIAEGTAYGRYIAKTKPKARIAVLYQDDEYGRDLIKGLELGLGSKASQIVGKIAYDPTAPDVQSQVAQAKSYKADTFMIFAFGKFAIQSYVYADKLGWRPQVFVNDVASASSVMRLSPSAATEGSISIVFGKDPTDPRFNKDPGILLFRQILKRYAPGADAKDAFYVAGMASAFTMVDTLKKAGKNLTREGVMNAAIHLNEPNSPFLLPGIVVRTTPTNRFPISQMQLQRWHNGNWVPFGGLITAAG